MMRKRQMLLVILLVPALLLLTFFWFYGAEDRAQRRAEREQLEKVEAIQQVRVQLNQHLGPDFLHNHFPETVEMPLNGLQQKLKVDYTIDHDLQAEAAHLLKNYHPDYGAIIILDANTGA